MEVYFGIGFIVLFFTAAVAAILHGKWRAKQLRSVAESLNFSFATKNDDLIKSFRGLSLFQERNCQGWDFMQGEADGITITIFDNSYCRSSDGADPCKQTVMVFQSERLSLPEFSLRLIDWNSKNSIVDWRYQDIKFDQHPAFFNMYRLYGNDSKAVRSCFNDTRLHYLQQNASWSVDGNNNLLMICRIRKSVAVKDMQQFLAEGFEVFRIFESQGKTT